VRVFLVEDESPIAMLVEDMLEALGCVVACSAANVAEALRTGAAAEFDLALLDMNLAGESALPVAELLRTQGRRFVFVTGYGGGGVPDAFRGRPVVAKPFVRAELAGAMTAALSGLAV
jgi:CheY-like chemotaxis protein